MYVCEGELCVHCGGLEGVVAHYHQESSYPLSDRVSICSKLGLNNFYWIKILTGQFLVQWPCWSLSIELIKAYSSTEGHLQSEKGFKLASAFSSFSSSHQCSTLKV